MISLTPKITKETGESAISLKKIHILNFTKLDLMGGDPNTIKFTDSLPTN